MGMAHYEADGHFHQYGLLGDQVFFADALLEAFVTTGEAQYLSQAEQLTQDFLPLLEDKQGGGLYDRPVSSSNVGLLRFPHKSLADNLHATILLSKLILLNSKRFL